MLIKSEEKDGDIKVKVSRCDQIFIALRVVGGGCRPEEFEEEWKMWKNSEFALKKRNADVSDGIIFQRWYSDSTSLL